MNQIYPSSIIQLNSLWINRLAQKFSRQENNGSKSCHHQLERLKKRLCSPCLTLKALKNSDCRHQSMMLCLTDQSITTISTVSLAHPDKQIKGASNLSLTVQQRKPIIQGAIKYPLRKRKVQQRRKAPPHHQTNNKPRM